MVSSVAHCHSKHVVHRDIKRELGFYSEKVYLISSVAENFVFENRSPDAKLKLIDFGLATIMASPSSTFRTICEFILFLLRSILCIF